MTSKTKRVVFEENLARPDLVTFFLVMGLTIFGVLMVFDASVIEAYYIYNDKFHFIKSQIFFAFLGLLGLTIALVTPLKLIRKFSPIFFITAIILLIAVLIPGIGLKIQGARRWLSIAGIRLQPSELTKLASVVYFSAWLTRQRPVRSFIVLAALLLGLIMLEPDLGTALIVTGIIFTLYFLAGAPIKKFIPILFGGAILGLILIFTSPYRMARLKTFINPTEDPLVSSYHIRQVLVSLGSGGLTGTGIGRSRQKFQYLPEASTDSIFAVIGEELGLVGGSLVIIAFAYLILRGLKITKEITDPFAQLLAGGVIVWIGLQVILNLSAMVSIIPLTGVPMPFISYGGSSLVTSLTAVGLFLNASRYRQDSKTLAKRTTIRV